MAMNEPVILITATGGRPLEFECVMKWVARQDYERIDCWMVIEDSKEPYKFKRPDTPFPVVWVYQGPCKEEDKGIVSQCRNLQFGAKCAEKRAPNSIIMVIGDDDYYKPGYVSFMAGAMQTFDIAGHINTIYCRPPNELLQLANHDHAPMEGTAFRSALLPHFIDCCQEIIDEGNTALPWIDMRLWARVKVGYKRNLFSWGALGNYLLCPLKGHMFGRPGIGETHRRASYPKYDLARLFPADDLKLINGVWGRSFCG